MQIEIDNKGCVDLISNQSVLELTRYINTKKNYLRKLEEDGIIKPAQYLGKNNSSNLFAKNLDRPLYSKEYVSDN